MGLASTDDYKNYCPKDFYINPKQYDEILEVLKKEEHVSNFEVELKNLKDRHITR